MACGKPNITVGRKIYFAMLKHNQWKQDVYNNLDGFDRKFNVYEVGSLEQENDILIGNKRKIELLGRFLIKLLHLILILLKLIRIC